MRKQFAAMSVVFLLAGGAAYAQQDMGNSPVPESTFVQGTVESVSPSSLTVRGDAGGVTNLVIDDHTVGAEDLQVGDRVRVEYNRNEDGQSVAEEIQANTESNLAESGSAGTMDTSADTYSTDTDVTAQSDVDTTDTDISASASATTEPEPDVDADLDVDTDNDDTMAAESDTYSTETDTYSNEPATSPYASTADNDVDVDNDVDLNEEQMNASDQAGLPQTASHLPALALLGLLSLAGAVVIRFTR